jgi:hypothetical protein
MADRTPAGGMSRRARPTDCTPFCAVMTASGPSGNVTHVRGDDERRTDGLLRALHGQHLHAVPGKLNPDNVVIGAPDLVVERGARAQT